MARVQDAQERLYLHAQASLSTDSRSHLLPVGASLLRMAQASLSTATRSHLLPAPAMYLPPCRQKKDPAGAGSCLQPDGAGFYV